MSSAPLASIIRQPHGPSSNGFGAAPPAQQTGSGPPTADAESALRRHNTVSAPRHQPSASVSATPVFHGSMGRFRSGSLTGSSPDPGLVRKGSGRAVRKEEAVLEATEEGTTESSLPSRRGLHKPIATSTADPLPRIPVNAPPRPPRRSHIDDPSQPSGQPPPSAHSASHSLSSLAMFSPPASSINLNLDSPVQFSGALVSRTQSLRAQAKHSDSSGLGRSYSLKAAGEHRSPQTYQAGPPVYDQHNPPSNTFASPSPPPVSSSAAFPPFQLPSTDDRNDGNPKGSDLRRHQSLTQGYGSSSRVRDRLERSPVVPGLQQREGIRRLDDSSHIRTLSQDQPPTSPIGRSVWSPSHVGDDGWGRPSIQQLQETFQAMNFNLPSQEDPNRHGKTGLVGEPQRPTQDSNLQPHSQLADEPSWVANLVGHADRTSPQPPRTASAPNWQDRDPHLRQQPPQNAPWPVQPHYINHPYGFMPQQPMLGYENRQSGAKTPVSYASPYTSPYPAYLGPNFNPLYPSPPGTAPLPSEDADVIRLAKSKGLNPASFNCQPPQARFFVIKSYTEEDVQKSLKHEIWSSTVLGNKRLDTAFRESSDKMPIYLFFSVNGSRHFCGVAQMLTPVDETQSSNVWSENNKWKGIFKVKWIFVRDVPTAALRHIRLMNTPEQKPITNSRDTQELHYEAGCEVLQIFLDYQNKSKTSLLQDFAYYERLSANRPPSAAEQLIGAPAAAHPQANYNLPEPAHQSPYPVAMGPPGTTPVPPVPPVPPIPSRFR